MASQFQRQHSYRTLTFVVVQVVVLMAWVSRAPAEWSVPTALNNESQSLNEALVEEEDEFAYEEYIDESEIFKPEEPSGGGQPGSPNGNDGRYAEYEALYGKDMDNAPFAMQYAFENDTGMSWDSASLMERGTYVRQWHLADAQRQNEAMRRETEYQRNEAQRERSKNESKSALLRKENERRRIKEGQLRYQAQKKSEFERKVQEQKQRMKAMTDRQ